MRSALRTLDMKQASDDLCLGSQLTATNRVEERPFLHQQPSSCSSGMKQPFESGPAGTRTHGAGHEDKFNVGK